MVDREGEGGAGRGRGGGYTITSVQASTCRAVWNWEMALSRLLVANAYRPCSGQTSLHGEHQAPPIYMHRLCPPAECAAQLCVSRPV